MTRPLRTAIQILLLAAAAVAVARPALTARTPPPIQTACPDALSRTDCRG